MFLWHTTSSSHHFYHEKAEKLTEQVADTFRALVDNCKLLRTFTTETRSPVTLQFDVNQEPADRLLWFTDNFQLSFILAGSPLHQNSCSISHLQCTTIGPTDSRLAVYVLRTSESRGVGWDGTPWSGHAIKWNCLMTRSSPGYWKDKNWKQILNL